MRIQRAWVPVLVLVLGGSVAPAVRADSANNVFRFGAAWVNPDGEADVGGTQVDTEDGVGYFIDYERRLIPWLGLDFQVLYAKPDVTSTPPAGSATTSPGDAFYSGTFGVNFHLLARSRVDLYLGAFGNYTYFDSFEDGTGYGAVAGLDIGLTKSGLALTIGVRYSKIDQTYDNWLTGQTTTIPFDPLVGQLGLGWRF